MVQRLSVFVFGFLLFLVSEAHAWNSARPVAVYDAGLMFQIGPDIAPGLLTQLPLATVESPDLSHPYEKLYSSAAFVLPTGRVVLQILKMPNSYVGGHLHVDFYYVDIGQRDSGGRLELDQVEKVYFKLQEGRIVTQMVIRLKSDIELWSAANIRDSLPPHLRSRVALASFRQFDGVSYQEIVNPTDSRVEEFKKLYPFEMWGSSYVFDKTKYRLNPWIVDGVDSRPSTYADFFTILESDIKPVLLTSALVKERDKVAYGTRAVLVTQEENTVVAFGRQRGWSRALLTRMYPTYASPRESQTKPGWRNSAVATCELWLLRLRA